MRRILYRWLASDLRYRIVWRSGLARAARDSGSPLLRCWFRREQTIYLYVFMRTLHELRGAAITSLRDYLMRNGGSQLAEDAYENMLAEAGRDDGR